VILSGYGSAHRNGIGVVRFGQTFALQQVMSALPLKATLDAYLRTSAKGQKRTSGAGASNTKEAR
jgi:hypothetical protein